MTFMVSNMTFRQQLAIAHQRAKQVGDFDARWRQVRAELPESFAISRLADGLATLYYSQLD